MNQQICSGSSCVTCSAASARERPKFQFAIGSRVYVASRLENIENVARLCAALELEGHTITYKWCTHGRVWSPERTPAENRSRMSKVATAEGHGVTSADMVVVLLPGGRGTHVELGMALAARKPILLCSETLLIDEIKPFQKGKLQGPCAFYFDHKIEHIVEPDPERRLYLAVGWVREMTVELRQRSGYNTETTMVSELESAT